MDSCPGAPGELTMTFFAVQTRTAPDEISLNSLSMLMISRKSIFCRAHLSICHPGQTLFSNLSELCYSITTRPAVRPIRSAQKLQNLSYLHAPKVRKVGRAPANLQNLSYLHTRSTHEDTTLNQVAKKVIVAQSSDKKAAKLQNLSYSGR